MSLDYRMSFTTLFLWVLAVLLMLDAGKCLLLFYFSRQALNPLADLNALCLLAMAVSVLLIILCPSEVSPGGLLTFSAAGRAVFLRWNEISEVKRRRLIGLGFYQIRGADGTRVYVPGFLSRQEEFVAVVTAITPPENPLRRCLERSGARRQER